MLQKARKIQAAAKKTGVKKKKSKDISRASRLTPEPKPRDGPANQYTKLVIPDKKVTRCQGCPQSIRLGAAPRNMVLQRKAYRSMPVGSNWVPKRNLDNIYFHVDVDCLKSFNDRIDERDITCDPDVMMQLTDAHINILAQADILQYITANYEGDGDGSDSDTD